MFNKFNVINSLKQGFPTCGPEAARGPGGNFVWPVKSYTLSMMFYFWINEIMKPECTLTISWFK